MLAARAPPAMRTPSLGRRCAAEPGCATTGTTSQPLPARAAAVAAATGQPLAAGGALRPTGKPRRAVHVAAAAAEAPAETPAPEEGLVSVRGVQAARS